MQEPEVLFISKKKSQYKRQRVLNVKFRSRVIEFQIKASKERKWCIFFSINTKYKCNCLLYTCTVFSENKINIEVIAFLSKNSI